MSYRFFRYGGDGTQKIYQSTEVEIQTFKDGRECRIPIFVDTSCREFATIFPGDYQLASFFEDWFNVYCEEVSEEDEDD